MTKDQIRVIGALGMVLITIARAKPQLETKKNQSVEERKQEFSINTKQRESQNQKTMTTTTPKGA